MSNMEKQLDRIEHLLSQLIGTVANVKSELTEFKQEMTEFKQDMTEFKQDMTEFKQETYKKFEQAHFERNALSGQVALLHQRLDHHIYRIAKTEEELHILKERQ